jgi:hypothetical protein
MNKIITGFLTLALGATTLITIDVAKSPAPEFSKSIQQEVADILAVDLIGAESLSKTSHYSSAFSMGSFTNRSVDIPDDVIVYSSDFSWETPDSEPFRPDMRGVIFICSTFLNVIIPEGNLLINEVNDGTCGHPTPTARYKAQNDGEDWLINNLDIPIEPIEKERLQMQSKNTDPSSIPTKPIKQ